MVDSNTSEAFSITTTTIASNLASVLCHVINSPRLGGFIAFRGSGGNVHSQIGPIWANSGHRGIHSISPLGGMLRVQQNGAQETKPCRSIGRKAIINIVLSGHLRPSRRSVLP